MSTRPRQGHRAVIQVASQQRIPEEDDVGTGDAGRGADHSTGGWQALLGHILDSGARTQRAQQLLDRVLAAAVLTVVCVTVIVVSSAAWPKLVMLALAGTGAAAGAIRQRRRRYEPRRS
jgi:hypothetical protein